MLLKVENHLIWLWMRDLYPKAPQKMVGHIWSTGGSTLLLSGIGNSRVSMWLGSLACPNTVIGFTVLISVL